MEGLILMLSIIAWPVVMLITEYAKRKWDLEGSLAIAIVSLIVAILYAVFALFATPEFIEQALAFAGTTGFVAMTLYNFLKGFIREL